MSTNEDEFLKMLRETFRVEAAEHLQTLATGLMELEKAPEAEAPGHLVATVFRAAHSLTGAARAVDITEIESFCQTLEDMFASWKRQESAPSPAAFDTAHHALDAIKAALGEVETSPESHSSAAAVTVNQPLHPAKAALPAPPAKEPPPVTPSAEAKAFAAEGSVRISAAKLDAQLVEAEEMLTVKLTAGQRATDLRALGQRFEAWRSEWAAIEPEARLLRQALNRPTPGGAAPPERAGQMRLLEFIDWNHDYLKLLENSVAALTRTAQQDLHVIGKLVDDLLEDSKKLLLLPFGTLSASFPKLVRNLGRDLGKEADLVIQGEEVEIDKRVLEQMKDPLMHLLRNCVDHGVETPERRASLGKSARATITLTVVPVNGSRVEILVTDDGRGIDTDRVKEAAVKEGFLSMEAARELSDEAAQDLIFRSEVSTSPIITHLSGRGLGMTILREQTEKLGGTVSVESQPGEGSRFRIVLPSMLATFRGILVKAGGELFIVPTAHVECAASVKPGEVQTVENREVIVLGGRAVAVVRLAEVLGLPAADGHTMRSVVPLALVLGQGDQRIAFVVDAVLDEQEVLVKPFRKPLSRVRNIAGATVLGSGRVVLILNVADLLKSARKFGGTLARVAADSRPALAPTKSVLAVDDSATSRMLIKSMLESAGYKVKTAVDGLEAFTLLRAGKFDLLVSDVEMPRLNGFDLTAQIRADKKLAELPVVLITARETREDLERGIDVGANAYIVKSSLNENNLLEAVRRLV